MAKCKSQPHPFGVCVRVCVRARVCRSEDKDLVPSGMFAGHWVGVARRMVLLWGGLEILM